MPLSPVPWPDVHVPLIAQGGSARLLGDGIVYASSGLDTWTVRHAATVVVAATPREIAFHTAQGGVQGRLLVVRPLVPKRLLALQAPLVLVDLEPSHPLYRCFLRAPDDARAPGTCALPLEEHPALAALAAGFISGRLRGAAVDQAVQQALLDLVRRFPPPPPLDPRVAHMMALLDTDPSLGLGAVAKAAGVSAHRASQLFSQNLGLPWRRVVLSAKIRRAGRYMGSGRRLTDVAQDAGFTDSAHFARVWIQSYGASPSAFFPPTRTAMDAQALPDWRRQRHARLQALGLAPPRA
jgi:AraC-like DNA-binding protein